MNSGPHRLVNAAGRVVGLEVQGHRPGLKAVVGLLVLRPRTFADTSARRHLHGERRTVIGEVDAVDGDRQGGRSG